MAKKIFLSLKPYRFQRNKKIKNHLFRTRLIRYKYLLYIINKILNMVGPLINLINISYISLNIYNSFTLLIYFLFFGLFGSWIHPTSFQITINSSKGQCPAQRLKILKKYSWTENNIKLRNKNRERVNFR